jgi:hypothetical protein
MNARELRDAIQSAMTEDKSRGIGKEREIVVWVPEGPGRFATLSPAVERAGNHTEIFDGKKHILLMEVAELDP